jgi:hypothetical protein
VTSTAYEDKIIKDQAEAASAYEKKLLKQQEADTVAGKKRDWVIYGAHPEWTFKFHEGKWAHFGDKEAGPALSSGDGTGVMKYMEPVLAAVAEGKVRGKSERTETNGRAALSLLLFSYLFLP